MYPKHKLGPADLLHFIELKSFTKSWDELFADDEDSLEKLQVMIMCAPKQFPVVGGTDGLRKMRFARDGGGKSGGFRVCYVYFEQFFTVLLILVYSKNESDDIPDALLRPINTAIATIQMELQKLHSQIE